MLSPFLKIPLKSHRQVLNAIREQKEISGADLARLLNLQRSTMVYILRSLRKAGLIEVSRIGHSTGAGGKPPTLWRLVANKGYTFGLEIIPNEIRISVIDLASNLVYQQIYDNSVGFEYARFIAFVKKIILSIIKKLKLPIEKIIGVGVALPGLVESKKGVVLYSRPLSITNFPLREMLEDAVKVPVFIANDANAGALGVEWFQNKSNGLPHNVVYLTINEHFSGIGAGMIINNLLYEGLSGTAGEIVSVLPNFKKLIEEGKRKYYTSSARSTNFQFNQSTTLVDIVKYKQQDGKISKYVLEQISNVVSEEIIRIIGLVNPNLIVIGGDITVASSLINDNLLPTIKESMASLFPTGITIPKIEFSQFGMYSVSMGANAIVLREVFSEIVQDRRA